MSADRIVTGIRLLRAVMVAEREHDANERNPYTFQGSAEWQRTRDKLSAALIALADFEAASPLGWKDKQAGERE